MAVGSVDRDVKPYARSDATLPVPNNIPVLSIVSAANDSRKRHAVAAH